MVEREERAPTNEEMMQVFSRHLVAFTWYEGPADANGNPLSEPEFKMASGFIFQAGNRWWLVSAGHTFLDFEKRRKKKGVSAMRPRLVDAWDAESEEKYPPIVWDFFDEDVRMFAVDLEDDEDPDDPGLDYAIIRMPLLVSAALAQTVAPFSKADWSDLPDEPMDFHVVVGTPANIAEQFKWQENGQNFVNSAPRAAAAFATELSAAEADVLPMKYDRFVAKLGPIATDIKIPGMSGGPILGWKKLPEGGGRYYPVAIQSRCKEESGVIIGTRLAVIGELIDEIFRQIDEEESANH